MTVAVTERFWSKVYKTETCWNWIAAIRGRSGYGSFKYNGKVINAHRFAWFLTYGSFSKKLILHSCDNRKCVKISHLREGTHKDNWNDLVERGKPHKLMPFKAKETCGRGHIQKLFRHTLPNGRTQCRKCVAERTKSYRVRMSLSSRGRT